jgi:GNAT superfamily N-acetyltransferase
MSAWRLRRASPEDAPAVALVAGASFLEAFAGVLAGADILAHLARNSSAERFAAWALDPLSIVTLAEHPEGAAPVGYTLLTAPDLPIAGAPGDIELRRIYTLQLAHGTGLGAALMDRAIADARAADHRRLLLGVYAGNARARAFYARQGFAVAGTRQYRVGDTLHDDLIYARTL